VRIAAQRITDTSSHSGNTVPDFTAADIHNGWFSTGSVIPRNVAFFTALHRRPYGPIRYKQSSSTAVTGTRVHSNSVTIQLPSSDHKHKEQTLTSQAAREATQNNINNNNNNNNNKTPWLLVRKRSMPIEQPPPVSEF
jgi:hypothetical protein